MIRKRVRRESYVSIFCVPGAMIGPEIMIAGDCMEHRWGRRIVTDIPVHLVGARGALAPGHMLDLSVSGALMDAAVRLPLLSQVEVLANGTTLAMRVGNRFAAYVVRHTLTGFAVEWCEPSDDTVQFFMRAASEVPALEPHAVTSLVSEPESVARRRPGDHASVADQPSIAA